MCLILFSPQHLEQEKHELRRRFENREGEWEGRVSELETDVKQLQDELERQQVHLREADREKTRAVQELSEQNQRLLDQLSRVSRGNLIIKQQGRNCFSVLVGYMCLEPFQPLPPVELAGASDWGIEQPLSVEPRAWTRRFKESGARPMTRPSVCRAWPLLSCTRWCLCVRALTICARESPSSPVKLLINSMLRVAVFSWTAWENECTLWKRGSIFKFYRHIK